MLDKPRILYPLLGVLSALLLMPHLLLPLNSDNDTYQAMALAMEQGKGLPYLGSWDQNFPGVVFYHWLSIKLFGLSDLAFRWIDLLNRVAIALICFAIAKRYVSVRIAWIAVPLVCLHYLSSGFWNAGQRDGFALTWLLVALYQLSKEDVSAKNIVIASLSIALATFIRPTNAAFLLLVLPWIVKGESKMASLLATLVGFIGTTFVLLLPWLVQENGIREFFLATIRFNLDVYGGERDSINNLFDSLAVHRWFYVVALIGLIVAYRSSKRGNVKLLAGYGAIAAGVIAVMGKYHIYHFEVLLPIVIVFHLITLEKIGDIVKRPLAATAVVLVTAFLLFYPIRLVGQFIRHGANEASLNRIYRNLASYPDFGLRVEEDVIQYVESKGQLNNTEFLLLWPGLRWRSGESGMTRFTTTFALSMEGERGLTDYQQKWRREVDSVLTTRHPQMIVAATGPEYLFRYSRISPDSLLKVLPSTSAMLPRYSLDTTIGGYRIYRRSDATD